MIASALMIVYATVAATVMAVAAPVASNSDSANSGHHYVGYNYAHAHAHNGAEHHMHRRGYWGCGGCGSWGLPFASNYANRFNQNAYAANYHDNTFYNNNKDANVASNNVSAFNAANVIV